MKFDSHFIELTPFRAAQRLPREGDAYTPLELRVFIVGHEGCLRSHLPDDWYRMHRRNELALVGTITRNGIDFQRAHACVFIVCLHAVSVVIAFPGHLGVLLYLNDDIDIVEPIDLDFLA